jgi:phosphatidylinositol-3-phosphatase
MRLRGVFLLSVIAAGILQAGCGGGSHSGTTTTTTTGNQGGSTSSQFAHVFIVIEENHSYGSVIGNSSMPYLNGLATANGLATQYYADVHPSLPNYFMLTAGATIAQDDGFTGVVTQDNVVSALTAAGKTWKCYAEDLPSPGYLGGDVLPYAHHHNPFVYFSDVQNSSAQAANIVPMTQLATDISSNSLPDYAFIIPDLENDAHDCPPGMSTCTDSQTLANADQWLATNFKPLLASSAFKNSLLIITFDESVFTDLAPAPLGGGQVATVLVSPLAKPGYQSTKFYQHESALRLMMEGLGIKDLPGAAASAPAMSEFFK